MTSLIRSETEVGWKLNFGDKSLCNAEDTLPHDFCISVFIAAVFVYDALYGKIGADYDYTHFLPALSEIATALSGETPQIAVTVEAIQQIYILYFSEIGSLPSGRMRGSDFAAYALAVDRSNAVIYDRLTEDNRNRLADLLTVQGYLADSAE